MSSQVTPQANEAAARARALYDTGRTTIMASRIDSRFSYCLYVPPNLHTAEHPPELIVTMHGTGRSFVEYRDAFSAFGRWNNCIILSPLFPVNVLGDGNRDGFKHLREGDIRYDHVLLGMVDEVAEKYGLSFEKFALFGYSGGGHFTNRFALVNPTRLWAASIGAPGSVTQIDVDRDWWVGVRNMREVWGADLDLEALRQVAVHMIVGKADQETWEITHSEGSRWWMPGANDAGRTRPERLATLQKSFEAAGVNAKLDVLDNVPHNGLACVETVQEFFAEELAKKRAKRVAA